MHRTDGVDVEAATDAGGGHNVGWVKAGEWLEYTVDLPAGGGVYNLEFRVASGHPGGTFHVEFDGVDVTGPLRLSYTGGWQTWQTVTKTGITLPGGRRVMRLSIDSSDNGGDVGNINWVRIVPGTTTPTQTVNWAPAANLPLAREEGQGAVVNNKLYVFGGFHSSSFLASDRVDVYDPATNTWTQKRAMPERITHGATVVDGQTVWIVGGYVGDNPGPGTNHVWKYDVATDTWARGPDLPAARGGGAAGIVNRVIYFFGGRDGGRTSDRGETWSLDLNAGASTQWVARAPMPNPRNHLGGVTLNGKVYAVGGQTGEQHDAVNTALVHAYDPATNTWSRVADLPSPKSHFNASTFVRNGQIVVVGGESAHNVPSAEVFFYDATNNRWGTMTPIPGARRATVAGFVLGKIVVAGGYNGLSHEATTWLGT